ncbi:MAG TPA: fumarylacetoacetate hydrolase family protein [Actinomycetota bacterium]|jgi:2-keto-4-pentenoate hydratase/2-oxohepta-3-ene-1,7-dioic acid hydratase in catechol pathway
MRLVTYDRGGHRRLGAILEGEVVDLPDAVGHPVFPTTLEDLVSSSRGSVMDAARAALQRDEAMNWRVPRPRILTPLFPTSLLSPRAMDVDRRIVGPEQPVPWPAGAAWLDYEPMVAAVVGNEASRVTADEVRADVFGYTLVNDWRARSADGSPVETAEGVPISIGPCIVTADELDPQSVYVRVKVDDGETLKGNLNGAARSLFELIAAVSRQAVIERGDAFALGPFPPADDDADPSRRLWPGVLVELAAEGIGTLRNRIATR